MSKHLTLDQKAAVVIISLGAQKASAIYRYLKNEDIEKLTFEIARIQHLTSDETCEVLQEFYDFCLEQKIVIEGGVDYAKQVLEIAFGSVQANNILDKVTSSLKTKAFEFLHNADYRNLLAVIQNEHPQTIALILSYLRPDQSAMIIKDLPRDKKIQVVQKIAKMDTTSPEVVKKVEEFLKKSFSSVETLDSTQIGGVNFIANVINNMDRSEERLILDELQQTDMPLAQDIRNCMFIFEDIVKLDNLSIQKFIALVDPKDITYALKGSDDEVRSCILSNVSERMKEVILMETELLSNVRVSEVHEAQHKIVSIIRKLDDEGEIVIKENDIIA